jgi:hypothetical protein
VRRGYKKLVLVTLTLGFVSVVTKALVAPVDEQAPVCVRYDLLSTTPLITPFEVLNPPDAIVTDTTWMT